MKTYLFILKAMHNCQIFDRATINVIYFSSLKYLKNHLRSKAIKDVNCPFEINTDNES